MTTGTIDVRAGATINAAVRAINCWSSANLISISGTVHGEILAQAQGLVLSGKPIIDELNVRQYGPNADNLSDIMVDVNGLTGGQIGLVIKEHKIRVFTTEITGGNAATIAGYFTYVGETTDKLIIVAEGNYLTLAKAAFEVIDSNGQTVNITNLSQAIEHTAENEGSYVKIIEDSTISISLEEGKSAAIDVNGKEVTINGTGTIYGFDNSTDNYGDSEYGFLTVGEDVEVALDNTVDGKRYLAIEHGEDTNTYSFHRVEIKLTQIVLNVDKAALYYKAEFRSDDTLASRVESYGINFDLAGMPNSQDPDTLGIPFGEGEGCFNGTGKATSGYIYGIVTEDDPDNAANMGKPIYANPYLEVDVTGEDTVVGFDQYDTNTEVRKSLKDILNYYETNTDNSYSRLTEERKQVLAEFCVKMGLTEFTTLCAAVPAPAVPAPANEEEEEEA